MPTPLLLLGLVPPTRRLATWLLAQLALKAAPHVVQFLQDPAGAVARVGDVMVWNGEKGRHVIATLESLTESQARVEQVVGRIESAQLGIAGSLGTLTSLSMATLGVTSLAAGFLAWRMNALHKRLTAIAEQISDIQAHLAAQNQAHLQTALAFLAKYEQAQSARDLHSALEASTYATHLYQNLVQAEVAGRRRLIALNQCGRYHLLALTAQVRCLILSNELAVAEQRLTAEKPTLTALAAATFAEVMGKSPEVYLDPHLQPDHVTLDLLTEVYQQAHQLGAVTGPDLSDAGQAFEHFRARIYGAGGWFRPVGRAKETLLTKLKYLMACLEEVGRMESLQLRVAEARAGKLSLQELEKAVAVAQAQVPQPAKGASEVPVAVFALA